MRSNLVHHELAPQGNQFIKSEIRKEITIPAVEQGLRTRFNSSEVNSNENNKTQVNITQLGKIVEVLSTESTQLNSISNSAHQKQSHFKTRLEQVPSPKYNVEFEHLQTDDICFFNDEINEKKILDNSFGLDESFFEQILKESDSNENTNIAMTSIGDKIDFSIFKLENSVKNVAEQIPIANECSTDEDLDLDMLSQIMSQFVNQFETENSCEIADFKSNYSSQLSEDFCMGISNNVLVQRLDPMINGNGNFLNLNFI